MWTTPAPPLTALVASSIWSGVGEVNTSPGQAASSMPGPTNPPCIGSCPEPPPETSPPLPPPRAAPPLPPPPRETPPPLPLDRRVDPHDDRGVVRDAHPVTMRGLDPVQR